jgi:glycosyltransferase involved in cell wall biosynthesis
MKKGISIIIPCHNAGKYLTESVDSVLNQDYRHPFEIIIVDDCSDDPSTIIILNNLEKQPAVKLIRLSENEGAQNARSRGVKEARYQYAFTIDADDKLNIDKSVTCNGTYADRAVDLLSNSQDTAFVHGIWKMFGTFDGFTISTYPLTEELAIKKHHAQTSIVFRTEEAIRAGLWNRNIKKWQDWSFAIAILNIRHVAGKKNKIAFLNEPYYLYRMHDGENRISHTNVSEVEMTKLTVQSYPEIFRSYYPKLSDNQIVNTVIKEKPSKFEDILRVASLDVARAINMIHERHYSLDMSLEPPNIP